MKLELLIHRVRDVQFGRRTALRDGVLSIDRAELTEAVRAACGLDLTVELARPGEAVRLSNVFDLIEPRCKEGADGSAFPGFLGPRRVAGTGTTHALRGMAVVETGAMRGLIGGVIDLAGDTAELSPFGGLCHVVLVTSPRAEMDKTAYASAIRLAGLEAASFLARACREHHADERSVFALDAATSPPELPRLAYVFTINALGDTRESYLYGQRMREFTATVMHPNEILDGAVVTHHYDISPGMKNTTYTFQNHPVILELMRRHGRDLTFAGVVVSNQPVRLEDKERSAFMTARLTRHALRADGVLITKEGAGAGDYDLMRQCQAHEEMGVTTVLIDNEQINARGIDDMPLIDTTPHAKAMVSTGNTEELVRLPAVERVIGGETMVNVQGALQGPVTVESIVIPSANSTFGFTRMATKHW